MKQVFKHKINNMVENIDEYIKTIFKKYFVNAVWTFITNCIRLLCIVIRFVYLRPPEKQI